MRVKKKEVALDYRGDEVDWSHSTSDSICFKGNIRSDIMQPAYLEMIKKTPFHCSILLWIMYTDIVIKKSLFTPYNGSLLGSCTWPGLDTEARTHIFSVSACFALICTHISFLQKQYHWGENKVCECSYWRHINLPRRGFRRETQGTVVWHQ